MFSSGRPAAQDRAGGREAAGCARRHCGGVTVVSFGRGRGRGGRRRGRMHRGVRVGWIGVRRASTLDGAVLAGLGGSLAASDRARAPGSAVSTNGDSLWRQAIISWRAPSPRLSACLLHRACPRAKSCTVSPHSARPQDALKTRFPQPQVRACLLRRPRP